MKGKKNENETGFAAILSYRLMYGGCYLFGLLPHWFQFYVVVEVLYFFIYTVGRYRVRVVRRNLNHSFPEKDRRELRRIERRFYHNLSEYFIDAVDLASISEKKRMKRCKVRDLKELNERIGKSDWVAMLGHFGSWELLNTYGLQPDSPVVLSAYRPLSNKAMDMYYIKIRHRFGKLRSVPMNGLLRYYAAHKDGIDGHHISIALIADQNPPVDARSQWIPFLNQPTVFFQGGEKIARKFGLPVYFIHVRKIKRGHYEQFFELIWDGKSPTEEHEITNRFAALLEADIRRHPELWMWSHKRWKWELSGEQLEEYNKRWGIETK